MAVAALVAAVALAVAGCGGGDDEGDTSAPTTTAGETTTSAPATTTTGTEGRTTTGGGGSGGEQIQKRHSIPDVVSAVLVSADPAEACGDEYVTAHYLSVAYGGREGCVKAQSPESAAESLGFYQASVDGHEAAALVRPVGGLYDGEKLTVTVVRQGGGWRVDAIESNAPVGP